MSTTSLCPRCGQGLVFASASCVEGVCPSCVAARLLENEDDDTSRGAQPPPNARESGELFNDVLEAIEIPGFHLLDRLGRGGMGVVFRARQDSPSREVAIKILQGPGIILSPELRQRFAREIELVGRLHHPGIVPIYESGLARGGALLYYTMEKVDGEPLDRFLARRQPGLNFKLTLFQKLCAAVAYAHQQGVIHLDLTPANVIVEESGEPRLLDFGLGKALSASGKAGSQISLQVGILGSPCTMSPEQAAGRMGLDTRADVYSLGALLYHLLSREWPHEQTGDLIDVLHQIAHEPPRPLRRLDFGLQAILASALATDREKRYNSVQDLSADIGRYQRSEELSVRPLSAWGKALLWRRRKPLAAALTGVSILFAATLAVGGPLVAYRQAVLRAEIEQRETSRHENLVRLLTTADSASLVELYEAMQADLPAMEPILRERLADPSRPFGSDLRLKAALLEVEPGFEEGLIHALKHAFDPVEAALLARALQTRAASLIGDFKAAFESGKLETDSRMALNQYVALAQWAPEDALFWENHAGSVVDAIGSAGGRNGRRSLGHLARMFLPVAHHLRPYLEALSANAAHRLPRAILAHLLDRETIRVIETALNSDDAFREHFIQLERHKIEALAVLTGIFEEERPRFRELPEESAERERLGRVAVALIRLDRENNAWRQLGYPWPMRETLIDKLPRLGTSPDLLHWKLRRTNARDRHEEAIRSGIARCFLQFDPETLPPEMRENILKRQREVLGGDVPVFEKEPLETASWLLKRWGHHH